VPSSFQQDKVKDDIATARANPPFQGDTGNVDASGAAQAVKGKVCCSFLHNTHYLVCDSIEPLVTHYSYTVMLQVVTHKFTHHCSPCISLYVVCTHHHNRSTQISRTLRRHGNMPPARSATATLHRQPSHGATTTTMWHRLPRAR
jgi:hypothetical protein